MALIGEGSSKFGRLPYPWPKKLTDVPGDIALYGMTKGFTYTLSLWLRFIVFAFNLVRTSIQSDKSQTL